MPAQTFTDNEKTVGETSRGCVQTALHHNPFWLIGATTRDSAQRIGELAEEKSLVTDPAICQKARSDLTGPRTRLGAEVAWLPGLSPSRAAHLVNQLLENPMKPEALAGLPPLVHANLLAALLEVLDAETLAHEITDGINALACLVDEIVPNEVLRDIDEDRAVSGFPQIVGKEKLESEFVAQRRYYLYAIKCALDKLPPKFLVYAVTTAVEIATDRGKKLAPVLIDELVDSYEVEVTPVLVQEAANVSKLIRLAEDAAKRGEGVVKPIIDQLEIVARNWDWMARPIQLSALARGITHEPSENLSKAIRSFAVDLCNEHDMLALSQRLTALMQELFAKLPEVSEQLRVDTEELGKIVRKRAAAESQRADWRTDITYRVDLGFLSRDSLWISPDGVCWKKRLYPLDTITRVRWGGVQHSVNGVPTDTNYTVAFGDNRSEATVELKQKGVYSAFTDKLWKAVCGRMLTEMLERLKSGEEVKFGAAVVKDSRIILTKRMGFKTDESVPLSWSDVEIWSQDGSFYIVSQHDAKVYAALSYIQLPNVHILEHVVRALLKEPMASGAFNVTPSGDVRVPPKEPQVRRLSDLLG